MISRGKSRFVDEIHLPNVELRSCAELLSELQKSEGGEPCLAKSKTGNWETGVVHFTSPTSIKETCADTLSICPSKASSFTQRTILTKGSGKLFLPMIRVEELCHDRSPKWLQEWYVITIKMNDNLTHHFIGTP